MPFCQSWQQNQNLASAIMCLGVWDKERLRDRVEEKWDSREIGVENEKINRHCRRWAGAWVGGEWSNWTLQREEMKSVRTDWGEREATGRNGEGGERKKNQNILTISVNTKLNNKYIYFSFELQCITIFSCAL